ncbi:leukocyte tyrosine kinase receptor [Patella vulgata]|uniref:leukocyte tyrosine kinase receptor n=1 Tax=Patella vulgata TaxID=6465 RepID=UPI00217F8B80|nr:leukocyte tyrosine kinase receptor [Patella vulgata]
MRQKSFAISSVAGLQIGQWIAIFLPVAILITLVTCLLFVYKRRNRKTQSNLISLDRIMTIRQNGNVFTRHRRRQTTAGNINHTTAVMQFNPNYDVVIAKCPEQQLKELPRRHLKLTSLLGHGAFGEVYRGTLATGCQFTEILKVAVKTLPALCTDQTELDFLMEAVILSKFNHPNIVKLIGVCFESHPRYIILEVLEGGDLKLFLRESRPTASRCPDLTIRDLLGLCLDIARACHHLEDKHFIHRDIAARNCLLTTKGPLRKAKIADFGMARDIYRSDYYKKAGKALLPVKWMPPEAFLDGIFTAKTDIW